MTRIFGARVRAAALLLPSLVSLLGALPAAHAATARRADSGDPVLKYLRRYERVSVDVPASKAGGPQSFAVESAERRFDLRLEPNDLRARSYRAVTTLEDGSEVEVPRGEVTTYAGAAENLEGSQARFTVDASGVTGSIVADGETFFVEPLSAYTLDGGPGEHVLYRLSDVDPAAFDTTCATTEAERVLDAVELFAPAAKDEAAAETRVIEIATDADNEYVSALGGAAAANTEILNVLNQVEGVYQAELGLTLDVTFQHTYSGADPFSATKDSSKLLGEFRAEWNANRTGVRRTIAHLWTGRDLDGSTIGIAYTGVGCAGVQFAYGLSQRLTSAPSKYILTAHEIGHNFGAEHSDGKGDCTNTIMGSFGGTGFTFCRFSRDQISAFVAANGSCLRVESPALVAPSQLVAKATSGSQITLTWRDKSDGEDGFAIERKAQSGGSWSRIATTGPNATSYVNGGLSSSVTYYYRVRAVDGANFSTYSNEAYASLATGGAGGELIANGGFESGEVSWFLRKAVALGSTAYEGRRGVVMLGRGSTNSASLRQTPAFPAAGGERTLTFYLRISTQEPREAARDQIFVRIANARGETLSTLAKFSNADAVGYSGYALVTLSIPADLAVAGNELRFFAKEDATAATTFYVDAVSIR